MKSENTYLSQPVKLLITAAFWLEIWLHTHAWTPVNPVSSPAVFVMQYTFRFCCTGLPILLLFCGIHLFSLSDSVMTDIRRKTLQFCVLTAGYMVFCLFLNSIFFPDSLTDLRSMLKLALIHMPDGNPTQTLWVLINICILLLIFPALRKLHGHNPRLFCCLTAVLGAILAASNFAELTCFSVLHAEHPDAVPWLLIQVRRFDHLGLPWFLFYLCTGGIITHLQAIPVLKRPLIILVCCASLFCGVVTGTALTLHTGILCTLPCQNFSLFEALLATSAALLVCSCTDRKSEGKANPVIHYLFSAAPLTYLIHTPLLILVASIQRRYPPQRNLIMYLFVLMISLLLSDTIVYIRRTARRASAGCRAGIAGIALILLPFFALAFPPVLTAEFRMHDVQGEGNIFTYLSQDSSLIVRPTSWAPLHTGDTKVVLKGVQDDIQFLCFDINDIQQARIDGLTVYLHHIPVRHYTAQELLDSTVAIVDLNLRMDDGAILLTKNGTDDFFQLEDTRYFSCQVWMLWCGLIILFSFTASAFTYRFLPSLSALSPAFWPAAAASYIIIAGEIANHAFSAMRLPMKLLEMGMGSVLLYACIALTHYIPGILLGCTSLTIYYAANFFVRQFRGRPILPLDLSAAGTALGVACTYDFVLTPRLIVLLLTLAAVFLITIRFQTSAGIRMPFRVRCACLMAALIPASYLFLMDPYAELENNSWNDNIVYAFRTQGALPSFIRYAREYRITVPRGYSRKKIQDILDRNPADSVSEFAGKDQPERILMVMNESFADLTANSTLAEIDTIPYYHSLNDNCVKGRLHVSVQGGGTCNTEFESLTGNSMAFLPANTYPFVAHIKRDIPCLSTLFSACGYRIASLHLENPDFWYRTTVYQRLGLEPFYSIEDYSDFERINGRASDAFNYQALQELEEEMAADKTFIFNLTVQNHGGYTTVDNLTPMYDFSSYGDYSEAAAFFSLMRISDEEAYKLIEHYRDDPRRTMIIFYGDHQPMMKTMGSVREWLYGSAQPQMEQYVTPYFIWCNYDIPEYHFDDISANYLPYLIAKIGNFPLSPSLKIMEKACREYPVISAVGAIDKDGAEYSSVQDIPDSNGILYDYQCMQYNNLIDKTPNSALWELQP